MRIEVRFVGAARVLAGISRTVLDLSGEPTVKDVLVQLNEKYLKRKLLGEDGRLSFPCIVAVNGRMLRNRFVDLYQRLDDGDTVSLFPPPAGG